jgi:O-antigen ligase
MVLLVVALPLLIAPLVLTLFGRRAAGGVLLLFLLYTRLSDIGIGSGASSIDPNGLSSVAQAVLIGLTALIFASRTFAGRSRSLATQAGPWMAMGLYLAVLYASSIWAPDQSAATGQASSLLKNLLIVYAIAEIFDSPRSQRLAMWGLIVAGALMAGLTVLQAATQTYGNSYLGLAQAPVRQIVGADNSFRSSGPIGDPNFYALILAALVPIALIRVRDEKGMFLRVAALLTAILLFAAIVLTYSRGGLVTIAILIALYIPIARIRARSVCAAMLLLLPLLALVPGSYWGRIATLTQGDSAIASRAGSQEVALAIFEDHPFLGIGANNYTEAYFPYALRLNMPGAAENSHNLYLAVAAETGLLGLVAFSGSMFFVIRAAWKRRASSLRACDSLTEGLATSCVLSLCTYLVGVIFLPIAYPRYLWVLVGLALAVAAPTGEGHQRTSMTFAADLGEAA